MVLPEIRAITQSEYENRFALVTTVILVGATIGLVGMTYQGNRKSHLATQQSNQILSQELRATMIPLLEFRKPHAAIFNLPRLFNPSIITQTLRIGTDIKNNGKVPARKILCRGFLSEHIDIDNLVREVRTGNYIEREFGTITQGGVHTYVEDILWFHAYEPRKWIMYFEYDYLDVKREKAFAILDLVTEWDNIENKWYVHDDIIESEKRQGLSLK